MRSKEGFEWRKQDYFWLIGILIFVIILIATIRLKDNSEITNMISLIASGVSIALAIVAIWWGQVNNDGANRVYQSIENKLNRVSKKTEDIVNVLSVISEMREAVLNDVGVSEDTKAHVNKIMDSAIYQIDNLDTMSQNYQEIFTECEFKNLIEECEKLIENPQIELFGDQYIEIMKKYQYIRQKQTNINLTFSLYKKINQLNEIVKAKLNTNNK